MKSSLIKYSILGLSFLYMIFFIVHIWTDIFSPETFWKISLTFGVLLAFDLVCYFIIGYKSDSDLKKDGFLGD